MTKSDVPITFVDEITGADNVTYDEHGSMFKKDVPAGSVHWSFSDETSGYRALQFTCPCGCGRVHVVPVRTKEKCDKEWLWNGDSEKPTLTPSILATTGCRWHGYLTDGVFKPC